MTLQQELQSWFAPRPTYAVSDPPKIGEPAPRPAKLGLKDNKPTIIAFLRHCGCPFAEKTYLVLREAARKHVDIDFIAVSHSDEQSTHKWFKSIGETENEPDNLRLVVDNERV
jgi:hypothetical protein